MERLVAEHGSPLMTSTPFGPAVRFGFEHSAQFEPPPPKIQTLISFHTFDNGREDKAGTNQFYILCGKRQGPFHGGDPDAADDNCVTSGHGAWDGAGGAPFHGGTLRVDGAVLPTKMVENWTDTFKVRTCLRM